MAFSTIPETFFWAEKSLDLCWQHMTDNRYLEHNLLWNVNVPAGYKGILLTRQGNAYYRDSFREVEPGHYIACGYSTYKGTANLDEDLDAVMNGYISITPLTVNRTALDVFNKLK